MSVQDGYWLQLENLACGRDERALFSGFDQVLRAGEIVRVLGDNGVGKTTLLRTLARLLEPLAGRVHWQHAAHGPTGRSTSASRCVSSITTTR